ncbi:unnamed protein product [Victoria cruziana]
MRSLLEHHASPFNEVAPSRSEDKVGRLSEKLFTRCLKLAASSGPFSLQPGFMLIGPAISCQKLAGPDAKP